MRRQENQKPKAQPFRGIFWESFRYICRLFLRLNGWRVRGDWPMDMPKAVVIFAPHTSNWDAVWALCTASYYRVWPRWLGKAALMKGPAGGIVRWLGGIPIERSGRNNVVVQMKSAFAEADELILGLAPEGSRSLREEWKTGYYAIAHGSGVPIIMAGINYEEKWIGVMDTLVPSGDLEQDRLRINQVFSQTAAKHPERFSLDQSGEASTIKV